MADRGHLKLGRRPHDPWKPHLKLGKYIDPSRLPPVPPDLPPPGYDYPMFLNDTYGTCVPAGFAHAREIFALRLGLPVPPITDSQIVAWYKTQNPGFPDQDDGMVIQDFLAYLAKTGQILGFAGFSPSVEIEANFATDAFLAPIIGADLRVPQQTQDVWDYVPNARDWGGHCIPWNGYQANPDEMGCVTWGAEEWMTRAFITNQVEEAWVIITQEFVDHPPEGFNLSGLADDYEELTGRPFPVVVNPPTPPVPPVPPPPEPPPPPPDVRSWWQKLWDWIKSLFS